MNINYRDHKNASEKLEELYNIDNLFFIHYACENIFEGDEPPRITSISVYCRSNDSTKSFDFNTAKTVLRSTRSEITDDLLEKQLLQEFVAFSNQNAEYHWIHWNMSSSRYGFDAVRLRCIKHAVEVPQINDSKKINLETLLSQKYGPNFIESPKMVNLAKLNGLWLEHMIEGKFEPEAFRKSEYAKLQISTSEKTRLLYTFFRRSVDNHLKTNTNWLKDIYGISVQGIFDFVRSTWWGQLMFATVSIIIGAIIGKII